MLYSPAAVLQLRQHRYPLLIGLAIAIILALHLVRLADLPAGLYLDEGSVGINAIGIARSGVDEFGTPWPIYFRAFGEYKNPIYIYLAALIFKIVGISEHNLRFPSFLFYAGGLAFSLVLVAKLFSRRRPIEIYALITLGVLPMYFLISRIAFEVISQFTWVAATNVCLWQTFEAPNVTPKRRLVWALLSGLLMGTSIYTYTTARLLSLLMLMTVWGVYWGKPRLKLLLAITTTFGLSLLPYVYFVVSNPGAITSRFRVVSYLYWDVSIWEKIRLFVTHYLTYISPRFLINVGDPNWRHTTSVGGIIFATTLFLFTIGLISLLQKGRQIDHFSLFLIINLVFSPVAGSLTFESIPQSLRVHLLAYYIVIISCFGLQYVLDVADLHLRRLLCLGVAVLLSYEIIGYQVDFFGAYPARSIRAMESFSIQQALQYGLDQNPERLVFVNAPRDSYANFEFYRAMLPNEAAIPLEMSENPTLNPGDCLAYPWWSEAMLDASTQQPFTQFQTRHTPNALERLLKIGPVDGIMRTRCYEP